MQKIKDFWNTNVDTRMVASAVVATFVVGGILYGAKKSGIGIVKKAAVVAQGGK